LFFSFCLDGRQPKDAGSAHRDTEEGKGGKEEKGGREEKGGKEGKGGKNGKGGKEGKGGKGGKGGKEAAESSVGDGQKQQKQKPKI
jgi:hypothetical protein